MVFMAWRNVARAAIRLNNNIPSFLHIEARFIAPLVISQILSSFSRMRPVPFRVPVLFRVPAPFRVGIQIKNYFELFRAIDHAENQEATDHIEIQLEQQQAFDQLLDHQKPQVARGCAQLSP